MANFLQESTDKFCYVYSCELDIPVRIKIGTLEGHIQREDINTILQDPLLQFSGRNSSQYSDFYVECQVYADGKPLCLPVRTSYKAFTKRWNWNEWLELPLAYKDLPRNVILGLTVYDISGSCHTVPIGGTTVSLFGKYGCLRRGYRDLKLWTKLRADCSITDSTPGLKVGREDSETERLAKLVQQHRKGRMMSVDWLDRLTFREIEQINEREKRESNCMFLTIEFPKFHTDSIEYNVVFFEPDGDLLDESQISSDYSIVQEPDKNLENLVESKHHKLSHSVRIGASALDLKPNPSTKARLQTIIQYPPTHTLSTDEKSLVWQFRYYLSLDKGALTKFLQCVDWSSNQEREEGLDLLAKWQPIDPAASLELLTPKFQFPVDPRVRKYAISRLQCADNEELLLYLLQLVQALRYEEPQFIEQNLSPDHVVPTLVADETYSQATHNQLEAQLSDAFREDEEGYISVTIDSTNSDSDTEDEEEKEEGEREEKGKRRVLSPGSPPPSLFKDSGSSNPLMSFEASMISVDLTNRNVMSSSSSNIEYPDLASFLIARACTSTRLANYFHWYVYVECQEDKDLIAKAKYETIRCKFLEDLKNSNKIKWRKRHSMLMQQEELVEQLTSLMNTILTSKDDRIKRIERLQSIMENSKGLTHFKQLIRLPVDPHIKSSGIIAAEATLFKSALMPARFNFVTKTGETYSIMFKVGDDLRQDQLILQMIMLIDRLLRRENLDLKLTPYKVLACSGQLGFVQLVPKSDAVAHILATHKSIQAYFRSHGPSDIGPYGISPEIMDTYIKSCAGYCVITYILSVGDRHLDNLLLTESGNLIHIDFGYILGRDPKLFPPPMRLSKEMVVAMGGTSSKEFTQFRDHCYSAFLALRRSANLFLNLFSLMLDSGVPDIALEPDKTVQKVKDKFRLDLTDEEAVRYLQGLIDLSIRAIFPELMEKIHKIAQDFRK